ncbi:ferrous iron transport protein B [Helicobacter cappadocius]|uniref:Ferrous iron transport protein B n=1 Tax=Helicobacter cappadocius TaxID=3063998 RepID=A0AA90T9C8_9HELI|nr:MULTISPECIES: ferrous iron transport protein B [unclassified Helicobacter]MDO7253142.1 ferrous iron transport protein B [Helicobacter sp. faydin-H75]MDP2538732.1 ferrous iron transport protein B [Helicobacter sp. faydin-H76]
MQEIIVALVGQPNVGKSSLINSISGAHLKVGNFTGVTVEKAEASLFYNDTKITIIDLPGTYSLNDFTMEEKVTKDFLEKESYDIILNVVDSTNLERNLALSAQVLEKNRKTLIALNMWDEAQKENISIDDKLLSEILGVQCIPTSANKNLNISLLIKSIVELYENKFIPPKRIYADFIESQIQVLSDFLDQKSYPEISAFIKSYQTTETISFREISIMLLSQQTKIYSYLHDKACWLEISKTLEHCIQNLYKFSKESNIQNIFISDALSFGRGAAQEVLSRPNKSLHQTQKIDAIMLNKYLGLPIFLILMFIVFDMTFLIGGILQDWAQNGIDMLGVMAKTFITNEDFASLIGDGIIGGVGAVLSFLPLIIILYFGISLLESTGYMSRVAFLLDGIFHKFGLHGKSFIPLVTGFGCSVPAYMATRTLQNKNERLITLFVIGFMSCSARLPIYVLFVGAFFSDKYAGMALFGIYILGALVALLMAKFLKLSVFSGKNEPFVMEMPKYRLPSWRIIWFSIYTKVLMYIKKAATFIFLGSMIIWFASHYPKNPELHQAYEKKIIAVQNNKNISKETKTKDIEELKNELEELSLQQSYSGYIGIALKPIFAPMNFDWRLSISIITGFAAKEMIVSTLGVLYSLGDSAAEDSEGLRNALKANISMPTAIAFIIFIMFYIPCFAATISFGKEAGGIKFVFYLFIFTTVVAYIFSLIGFYVAKYLSLFFFS